MNKKVIKLKSGNALATVTGPIPVNAISYPYNAAGRQFIPLDLGARGYVEEEFLVSGKANVYEWYHSHKNPAAVRTAGAPYTSRILVRRPAESKMFSGNVIVETLNWARGYDKPWGAWAESWEYFLKRGDAWVGVTVRPSSVAGLKKFNAERYAALSFANPLPPDKTCPNPGCYPTPSSPLTEDGLAWDIISHVGALMKSNDKAGPLGGFKVKYVFLAGATGGDLSAYVAAIHPLARLDSGKAIYDGYVIKCTGSPGCVNQCEPKPGPDDPRCKLKAEVPVIRVLTQSDIMGEGVHPDWSYLQRRPDSDAPDDKFRLYEVAGATIMSTYPLRANPSKEDVMAAGAEWKDMFAVPLALPPFEFPLRYIINGAFDNIKRWVGEGIAPPCAEWLGTVGEYPMVSFDVDEHGNVKGGVRTPYVDVPLATYNTYKPATPLPKETLDKLYPDRESYVRAVEKRTDELLKERWLTPEDAQEIKEQAGKAHLL